MITAFVTIGEGYHNFHHQFPMDYRNAIKWYQYDPTKWFIWVMQTIGLASHLKTFPDNEVRKGQLTMQLKKLREMQDGITWANEPQDLPVINWESCKLSLSQTVNIELICSLFSPRAKFEASLDHCCWSHSRCVHFP